MQKQIKSELTAINTGVAEAAKKIGEMAQYKDFILDYGCGLGRNINYLKSQGLENLCGCDTSTQIKRTKENVQDTLITVSSNLRNGAFDYILCSHVLNVVQDEIKESIVSDIHRLLRNGGTAIIQVRTIADVKKAKNKEKCGDGYLIKKGKNYTYQEGISREKMCNLLTGAGFQIVQHTCNSSRHIVTVKKAA